MATPGSLRPGGSVQVVSAGEQHNNAIAASYLKPKANTCPKLCMPAHHDAG